MLAFLRSKKIYAKIKENKKNKNKNIL